MSAPTPTLEYTVTPATTLTNTTATQQENQVISTPTLAPTATPGPLEYAVKNISRTTGINDRYLFGLSGENLINLLISILIVILGILAGWLLAKLLRWFASITPPKFDDQLFAAVENQLKWLVALLSLEYATKRLNFLSPESKQWIDLIYFSFYVIVIATIVLKVIEYGLTGLLTKAATPDKRDLLATFSPLIYRLTQIGVIITSLAIILHNFGVNLSALLAILGLGGLAVSLAAKETLEDMINGFIILIDRPYQIGDRIKIETMDSWGNVESIGMRTTRIRTLDNRLVIVPNSVIGRNQVENFTYPDPSYRIDVSVGVGYGSDIDQVEKIIESAVLSVPEVMQSKPPIIELAEFGDSALIFRALYWFNSYTDFRSKTKVNKAIYQALTDEKIDMPFITYDINLAYKDQSQRPENDSPDTAK